MQLKKKKKVILVLAADERLAMLGLCDEAIKPFHNEYLINLWIDFKFGG